MIKIKTIEVAGFAAAVSALRLPFGLEKRSTTHSVLDVKDDYGISKMRYGSYVDLEPKDLKLMSTLIKRGDEHAKVIRGIQVYAEIEAPIWFYRELETYRFGRERLSSESTMHIDCKNIEGEELERVKSEMPMGKVQKTIDVYSYQTLRRIWKQRHNHRLPMWHDFCRWIETLPFADELILVGLKD